MSKHKQNIKCEAREHGTKKFLVVAHVKECGGISMYIIFAKNPASAVDKALRTESCCGAVAFEPNQIYRITAALKKATSKNTCRC